VDIGRRRKAPVALEDGRPRGVAASSLSREAVDALTPTLDHIVIDRGEQVKADAGAIKLLAERVPVVAFVNNHFAGYAPETVRQLVALTGPVASA
jgi:hypothetical protein